MTREKALAALVEKLRKRVKGVTIKEGWIKGARPRWCREIDWFREELERALALPADAPPAALKRVIEHDRSIVASAVTAIKNELHSYSWLIEGRGSYEWDDDRWHKEFGTACEALRNALEPLVILAGDLSNSPTDPEEIRKARTPATPAAEPSDRERAKIIADWFYMGHHAHRELIERIKAEFAAVRASTPTLTESDVRSVMHSIRAEDLWEGKIDQILADAFNAILAAKSQRGAE